MKTHGAQINWFRRLKSVVLIAFLGAATAACGQSLNPFSRDVIDVGCPPIGAFKEAETLTRFRPGPGRDLTDVRFDAKIGRTVGLCKVTQSTLTAEVNAGIELFASRGPALEQRKVPLEYFIAIQAPNGKIASRQSFAVEVDFGKGLQEARLLDYLTFKIPEATAENLRGYRIFFGLQMTREEWDFASRTRAGAR